MGIYTTTALCYGFYTTAKAISGLPKDWYISTHNGFLIFVPCTFYRTKQEFPTLEMLLNQYKVVEMTKLEKEFGIQEDQFTLIDEDKVKLLDLAQSCKVQTYNIGKYVIEFMATTLGNDFSSHVSGMAKIV